MFFCPGEELLGFGDRPEDANERHERAPADGDVSSAVPHRFPCGEGGVAGDAGEKETDRNVGMDGRDLVEGGNEVLGGDCVVLDAK